MRSLMTFIGLAGLLLNPVLAYSSTFPIKDGEVSNLPHSPRIPLTSGRGYEPVLVNTSIHGIRLVYGHNLAWVEKNSSSDEWWYFFCFNDNWQRMLSFAFTEDQIADPGSWIQQYLWEGDENVDLRYACAQIVEINGVLHPQAFMQPNFPDAVTEYTIDVGGIGSNNWTITVPLSKPWQFPDDYSSYMPSTSPVKGTGDIHLEALARDNGDDSHIYWKTDFLGDRLFGPTVIFYQPGYPGEPMIFRTGYEGHQLVSSPDGNIVAVCVPAYQIGDTNPDWDDLVMNPLTPVVRISRDAGVTWGDAIWLNRNTVPDLPGTFPGCENLNPWGWHKRIAISVDAGGDVHVMATITDPANNSAIAAPEIFDVRAYGIYHILGRWSENEWVWSAHFVTNGSGLVPPNQYGATWIVYPRISMMPDGRIVCSFSDVGYIDPSDDSWSMDVFLIGSTDGGETWGTVDEDGEFEEGRILNVTGTDEVDEVFVKLIEHSSDSLVTAYGLQGDYSTNGPLVAWFVPLEDLFWEICEQFDLSHLVIDENPEER